VAHDLHRYIGRTVLVQLDEHTMTGTLAYASDRTVTLQNAALLPDQGEATDMDGDVIIDRYRVIWMQVA
jgi:hypothetical protein